MSLKQSPQPGLDHTSRVRPREPWIAAGLCHGQRRNRWLDLQVGRRTVGNGPPVVVPAFDRQTSGGGKHWRLSRASVGSTDAPTKSTRGSMPFCTLVTLDLSTVTGEEEAFGLAPGQGPESLPLRIPTNPVPGDEICAPRRRHPVPHSRHRPTPGIPAIIGSIPPLRPDHPKNTSAALAFAPSCARLHHGRLLSARSLAIWTMDSPEPSDRVRDGLPSGGSPGREGACGAFLSGRGAAGPSGRHGWFHAPSPPDRWTWS